jgi:hypothetical protein
MRFWAPPLTNFGTGTSLMQEYITFRGNEKKAGFTVIAESKVVLSYGKIVSLPFKRRGGSHDKNGRHN